MVDRNELRLGQHVVVRLCGGETVGAVVDGLCNDWVGVRPDRGGYVIADWEDIEVEVDAEEVVRTEQGEVLAEKKPASTEDMPYITDEHFWEREPADSFKYKLAEYMTKCCTKKEGPYGYTYGISAETILKMAEEELLKRGVVQKPAEWSEEDERIISDACKKLEKLAEYEKRVAERDNWEYTYYLIDRLKSLRPSWKPSEEQMKHLEYYVTTGSVSLKSLYEQLKKL